MDIREISKRREELEAGILKLISDFEKITGLSVEGVALMHSINQATKAILVISVETRIFFNRTGSWPISRSGGGS